jgi:GxxExxY protein
MLHEELTEKIIAAFYKVYNTLGYGFLEKVYERAMCIELEKMGLEFENQKPIRVFYDGQNVGDFAADIVVEELVIAELKALEFLREDDEFQLINYLKATEMEVGLLFNFGKKPEFRRKIFTNDRKNLEHR